MQKNLLFSFLTLSAFLLSANQGYSQHNDEEDHHHHDKNEISVALGIVPLASENKIAAGLHLHYIRGIAFHNKLGVGAGLETILDEHKHYMVSVVFQYRIYKGWTVAYGPGILIIKETDELEYQFAQHIETAYEFDTGAFHIGPMVEIGLAKDDFHYMIGVHFGIDF